MNHKMQNAHLNGNEFQLVQKNKSCVLLIHGFTATPVEVKPLGLAFFNAGYDVFAPLVPGHNTTPEALNKTKYTDWIQAVEKKYQEVKEQYDLVFVAGESMGGLLASYLAEQHPEIAGVLLYAPAISVKNLSLSRYIKHFKPIMGTPTELEPGVDYVNETYQFPWKGYQVKPTFAAHELYKLQKTVKKDLSKITQPLIIFQGMLDHTVDISGAKLIYQTVDSSQKELLHFEKSSHCIILDQEFDEVCKKSIEFLKVLSLNHEIID